MPHAVHGNQAFNITLDITGDDTIEPAPYVTVRVLALDPAEPDGELDSCNSWFEVATHLSAILHKPGDSVCLLVVPPLGEYELILAHHSCGAVTAEPT